MSYQLEGESGWSGTFPTATDAGPYTVYYRAVDPNGQYATYESHVTVTIAKADLEGAFAQDPYTFVTATDGTSYDSAEQNPLTITSANYTADTLDRVLPQRRRRCGHRLHGESTIVVLGPGG